MRSALTLAVAILALAGCGGGGDTTIINQTTTQAAPEATTGVTGSEGEQPDVTVQSAPPGPHECGDLANGGTGIYNIETKNLLCDDASKVAEAWERDCLGPPGECSASGYDCTSKATGEASYSTCVKGDAEIRFAFASFDPPS